MQTPLDSPAKKLSLVISPNSPILSIDIKELWQYRDLVRMLVKRDFSTLYKQTILGPLWFVLQPLLTTFIFVIVFSRVAQFPTAGIPPPVFYLSGLVVWNYFSTCLTVTANTFVTNAALFGKVYFPRLIVPISSVLSALISFSVQFGLLLVMILFYCIFKGMSFAPKPTLLLLPFLLMVFAALGLGAGVIVSALTTKYRDLSFLVTFGMQLLLYATPVIYPSSFLQHSFQKLVLLNPLTSLIELFRYILFGSGTVSIPYVTYSLIATAIILISGVLLFNRVEKSFIDII